MSAEQSHGTVTGISGPIVQAEGMLEAEAFEVVRVGEKGLIGEVLQTSGNLATLQVYEKTEGLRPGDVVRRTGEPLSLLLGPGLLGNIFDGLQRPLRAIAEQFGTFLQPGATAERLDTSLRWRLTPRVEEGDRLSAGQTFGVLPETESLQHRLMVPPQVEGTVASIKPEGDYTVEEVICVLETENGGEVELTMRQDWPARRGRPFGARQSGSRPLVTGQRVIDSIFPVARGGAACMPGDFGTGKTVLQHQFAKWSDADVVVYVGCGERGNEMTDILRSFPELKDPRTGRSLMERTVLIANTSNMPVAAREVSIYTGITIAEYYRDMGYAVGLMADSTSRWAEALREASSRLEEMPAEEGFPAYLSSRLAQFYERAGQVQTLGGQSGSVTVIGAVSPPGGDFSEPVTQHTTRFTRCFWALDPDLAYSRHYPAVSWLESHSEYVDNLADWWRQRSPDWREQRETIMDLLSEESDLQQIVKLVGRDVLPDRQRLVLLAADMFKTGFLQQDATHELDMYCPPAKQSLLLRAFVQFYRRAQDIVAGGAPIGRIRELPVIQELRRAKEETPNDDLEPLRSLVNRMDEQLGELERQYA